MPELPEAEVVARQVRDRLLGATIKDCRVGRDDIVRQGLSTLPWYAGACLTGVTRHGKSVALAFTRNVETRYLVAELGMTGLLLFGPLALRYQKHTHLVLTVEGGKVSDLRYWNPRRFGRLYLLDQAGLERFVTKRFGCDPLTVSKEEFYVLIRNRRGRLKPLLMRQQLIAGIGNIYANEILFRAKLHPNQLAHRLSEATINKLYSEMRMVLAQAIKDGGSSVRDFFAPDGSEGRYKRRHLVYGKHGEICPRRCGTTIKRLRGADQRSSFICPSCQRLAR
ncbi:MAG: bifunctional DNA-formamidopyrimidine glycosylase/DNA-(apurinic or apyrimidinic site) lyase [Nitrospira sp.]|nr:bifunctional DNA-formamidopyrimidine glycosylase/DNA-(apurinic or apyrimidinic site) lyase [Nitrospira sp.]